LENNLVGPLIDKAAVSSYLKAIDELKAEGGNILCGAEVLTGPGFESGCYVKPTIAEAKTIIK
jgi:aldehyde dehydrogenase (NAD+)